MDGSQGCTLERPYTVDEAVSVHAEAEGSARILAGGQSLIPLISLGLSRPSVLVSLDRCHELNFLDRGDSNLSIGAMATTASLETLEAQTQCEPVLAAVASKVGSPHVRNFGTVVGNVCHADPGGDLIPALLCLEGSVCLRSPRGERVVKVDEFVVGPFTTTISDDEIALTIEVPDPGEGWSYGCRKVVRRSGDLAMATCVVMLRTDGRRLEDIRISVGGAVTRASRLGVVERALCGSLIDELPETLLSSDLWNLEPLILPSSAGEEGYLTDMFPRVVAATLDDALGGG